MSELKTLCQEDAPLTSAPQILTISYADILAAEKLLAEYALECSIPEIGSANPQRDIYAKMEASGMLHCLGVYQDGALVGFATLVFYVIPHYGQKVVTTESLFVAKEHRASGAGKELMRVVEAVAKEQGAVAILYSAPSGSQLERLLTLSAPYRRTNSTFCRSLR